MSDSKQPEGPQQAEGQEPVAPASVDPDSGDARAEESGAEEHKSAGPVTATRQAEGGGHRGEGGWKREHILPRFSLDRRVTVLVLLATVLVVGTIATLGIPLELIPRGWENPSLNVRATWPDSPAQEMLDKVTLPLEEELSTVPGLEGVFSFATTGFTRCFLRFKHGTDMDVAYREVRDRIERAKVRLPDEVDRVLIRKEDETSVPVFAMGLTMDPGLTDAYNLIQDEVVLPIQRIDGVAAVNVQGLEEKEVLIELDRERTNAAGLNAFDLARELSDDNFTLASGHVGSGGRKLLLRSVARYADIEALEARKVGGTVRLGDIATVRYAEPEKRYSARANSQPAAFMVVLKEGEANAVEVSRRIAAVIQELESDPRLSGLGMEVFFSQGDTILESLGILLDSGRIGAIFAALVLFFFLRRLRMTLIITLSIPLSVFIGLTAMYFAGETLNILSLLGLMISVGLLVDNSVVVAENIHRLHRQGLARREACIRGAGEISLAVVMATLTTVVVFLPVSLVDGQGQFFLQRLAIPITVSLVASLLVALIFVPLAVYLTLSEKAQQRRTAGDRVRDLLRAAYDRTLEPINRGYTRLLGMFLRRRFDLVLAILGVVVLTAALPMKEVKVVDVQEDEGRGVEIDFVFPQTTTLEESAAYFQQVEKILEEQQEALDLDGYFIFHRSAFGEVEAWLNRPRRNDLTPRQITEKLLAVLPEQAGMKTFTGLSSDDEKENKNLHLLVLEGEDPVLLETVAQDLEDLLAGVDGVLGVKRSSDPPADELALVVDRDRAQRLGINPQAVAGVVRSSLGGQALPKFYREGREIPVRVRFQEKDRESLSQLFDFQVPTGVGDPIPLAAVTSAERLGSPKRIFRRNKRIARAITLELEEEGAFETRQRLARLSAEIDLPEGISFRARRAQGTNDEVAGMIFAMQVSVLFIYLLMGFLFESFILPLSIVTTIPLAVLGVYWIHFFAGYDLDPLGMVGIVLLIGVVVNNGIVLVDTINRLRSDGRSRRDAVLTASYRRFRPIMMTAMTTICGMVPLTLGGATSIGLSYTSFGLTLIGGMTSATLLTLLVVPVSYTAFDDLRLKVSSAFRLATRRQVEAAPEPVEL